MKRRSWLLGTAAAGGVLVVGWLASPLRTRTGDSALMHAEAGEVAFNGWIKLAADGAVVLAMPRSEMGQGVHTALAMLAAEELDVPLSYIRLQQANSDAIYGNVAYVLNAVPFRPQHMDGPDAHGLAKGVRWVLAKAAREANVNATGGSATVRDGWLVVRYAAAAVRAALLAAAARRWSVPVAELQVTQGVIRHPGGRAAEYRELAQEAVAVSPGQIQLKDRSHWTLIGTSAPRLDIPSKVTGTARFGADVRPPGLLYAALRLCPTLGGSVASLRADAALAMPGAQRLVILPSWSGSTAGFAVVGRTWWHAQRAAQAVEVEWASPPVGVPDSRRIRSQLVDAVRMRRGFRFHEAGDVDEAWRKADRTLDAWYSAPYLAHPALEPMNCTARVQEGDVERSEDVV